MNWNKTKHKIWFNWAYLQKDFATYNFIIFCDFGFSRYAILFQTVNDLNEQIRDLMMHFDAEAKIQNAVETNEVTEKVFFSRMISMN